MQAIAQRDTRTTEPAPLEMRGGLHIEPEAHEHSQRPATHPQSDDVRRAVLGGRQVHIPILEPFHVEVHDVVMTLAREDQQLPIGGPWVFHPACDVV